jgi:ABC-type antimicrobial peptide transport system permease subunit
LESSGQYPPAKPSGVIFHVSRIRIALGAPVKNIVRVVTLRVFLTVLLGAVVGLMAGVANVRFVETLLYGVRGTDMSMIMLPGLFLLLAAIGAAAPGALRAARIDPARMLRVE